MVVHRNSDYNEKNTIYRIQGYGWIDLNMIGKEKTPVSPIISVLYIPTIADDVAVGLLKLQIDRVIWFIQMKKKQRFLANYCTYLPEKIRRRME